MDKTSMKIEKQYIDMSKNCGCFYHNGFKYNPGKFHFSNTIRKQTNNNGIYYYKSKQRQDIIRIED